MRLGISLRVVPEIFQQGGSGHSDDLLISWPRSLPRRVPDRLPGLVRMGQILVDHGHFLHPIAIGDHERGGIITGGDLVVLYDDIRDPLMQCQGDPDVAGSEDLLSLLMGQE